MNDKYTYKISWSEIDQEFVGLCLEFPGLSWLAKSHQSAFKGIKQAVAEVVIDIAKTGEPIPEPLATKKYSGKLMLRVPLALHRRLAISAVEANISLNRYINEKLSSD